MSLVAAVAAPGAAWAPRWRGCRGGPPARNAKMVAIFTPEPCDALAIKVLYLIPGSAPVRLVWTDKHPKSVAGCGVLRFKNRADLLDAETFRDARDRLGATIITSHPAKVRLALGVPTDEPGVEEQNAE